MREGHPGGEPIAGGRLAEPPDRVELGLGVAGQLLLGGEHRGPGGPTLDPEEAETDPRADPGRPPARVRPGLAQARAGAGKGSRL
jgi:hypothetical protein